MSRFIAISLKRASVTLLIATALVVAGIWATLNINQELTPELEFPLVTVVTPVPGSTAEDVAEQVTIPLESSIGDVAGLRNLTTVSSQNVSIMVAEFEFGSDMQRAEQEIASGVSSASISEDAESPTVSRLNLNQTLPVIQMTLSGDRPITELEEIARTEIVPALRDISGVQDVSVLGGRESQIMIRFEPAALRERGITTEQISGALQANNISMPAGSIGQNSESRPVRVDSQITSVEEIENLVVGIDQSGDTPQPIRIADIASVNLEEVPAGSISRTNGMPSVSISVTKSQGANTVEVANSAVTTVEEIEPNLEEGVEVDTLLDQSTYIEESISGLSRDALIGAVAAIVAVWLMLLSFRSALISGVSIPLSVLFAILILYFQNFSLNILTLGGLAIAIGRVVDDSIVVVENVYRHIQDGDQLDSAIVSGAREVAIPVFGSTLTAVGVFLPLIFAGGIVGVLFRPFALTVTIALIASTVIALTIVPVVTKLFIGRRQLGQTRREERDTWLQRFYTPILRWSLTHRLVTVVLVLALFAGSLGLLTIIPATFLPEQGETEFSISVSMPPGVGTTEEIIQQALEAEEVVANLPDVALYNTSITLGGGSDVFSLGRALQGKGNRGVDFFLELEDDADVSEIRDTAQQRLEALDEDLTVSIQGDSAQSQNQLQVSVVGDNRTAVRESTQDVFNAIQDVEGLEDLSTAATSSQTQLVIDVDSERALTAGVTAAEVAQRVRGLIARQPVGNVSLEEGQSQTSVILTAEEGAIENVDELGSILVGPPDQAVPLSEIAEIREESGPVQLTRQDGRSAGVIQGQISGRETGVVQDEIDQRVEDVQLPEGVSIEYGGTLQQFQEGFDTLFLGIGAAIVIVYVTMVLVMGSLVYPFIIMFTLPLTSIGALAALAVTGRPLSVAALFGVLMLVGIVVANGIVLIDFINQLRDRGVPIHDALMEGGRLRVRPVLMTAVSTILALLPMALGLTEGAAIASDLAIVVIGGLISATLLTLVVVPVIYGLIESLFDRFGGDDRGTPSPAPATGSTSPLPPPKRLQ